LGDLVPVPQRPILLLQQDQVSVGRGSGGTARFLQQHEPQQAHHLGFLEQVEQESAQTDRLAAEFGGARSERLDRRVGSFSGEKTTRMEIARDEQP